MIDSTFILRSAGSSEQQFWCVVGFCTGIGLFFYGFRLLQRRRLILDTPFSKIRSASIGMVEISGLAVGPYTMVAPITARPCYYYRTLAWEWRQSGKSKEWVKVAGECLHVPFFVDDNTGRVLVDPRGADLDLHCDFKQEFNTSFFSNRDDAPANVAAFLTRHGIVTSNKIKVEEYCIKPKNSLFILGTLGENPGLEVSPQPVQDVEPIYSNSGSISLSLSSFSFASSSHDDLDEDSLAQRFTTASDATRQVVHLASPKGSPARTTDMTQQQKISAAMLKAGISNPAAWAAAGVPAAGGISAGAVQVLADPTAAPTGNASNSPGNTSSALDSNGFDPHPPVVLMKGVNNKTFLISWRGQQEIARTLGWKCTLMIWGGPALALVSLYIFLNFEHLF